MNIYLPYMKLVSNIFFLFLITSLFATAQNVTILPSGITPNLSHNYPRLSYDDILLLPSPQSGDIAYDLTFLCLRVYNGTDWICTFQNPNDPSPNISSIISEGGTLSEGGNGIVIDSSGNIFITGYFQGTVNFGTFSKTSNGGTDIFVAKYNSIGSLLWVQTAGGPSDDRANDIAVDSNGNVFVTGYFQGTSDFGSISKTSAGLSDIFVTKYDSIGNPQWVQTAGGSSNDRGNSLVVDVNGYVILTGYFQGTASFGSVTKTSSGSLDILLAKYSDSGSLEWVESTGGTSSDIGNEIAVDPSGNLYLVGEFQGTVMFETTTKSSAGSADIFVAKYNSSGGLLWVQTAGGQFVDRGYAIAIDANSNVFITGTFSSGTNRVYFGTIYKTSSVGYTTTFIAKYSSTGNILWVNTGESNGSVTGKSIAVDPIGNILLTGYFQDNLYFENESKRSAGSYDIFIVKYNNSGILSWLQTAGGPLSDVGSSITIDANGNSFITGYFQGDANFGAISNTSLGSTDIYVTRIQD